MSSEMSAPSDRAESIIPSSSGARPLFSEKLSVAWVRSAKASSASGLHAHGYAWRCDDRVGRVGESESESESES